MAGHPQMMVPMAHYDYDPQFLMYVYKVEMCTRDDNHDWARCPYAHSKEKAKRRDPRVFKYASLPCPDTMQGGACPRAESCGYTHNVQEYWLHPDRFKTQMCKNGAHCNRPLCFFAHRADELRFPDTNPDASGAGPSGSSGAGSGGALAAAAAGTSDALQSLSLACGSAGPAGVPAFAQPGPPAFGAPPGGLLPPGLAAQGMQLLPSGGAAPVAPGVAQQQLLLQQPVASVQGPLFTTVGGGVYKILPAGQALLAQQQQQQQLLAQQQQQQAAVAAAAAQQRRGTDMQVTPRVPSNTSNSSGWSTTMPMSQDAPHLHVSAAAAAALTNSGLLVLSPVGAAGGLSPPQLAPPAQVQLQLLQQQQAAATQQAQLQAQLQQTQAAIQQLQAQIQQQQSPPGSFTFQLGQPRPPFQ